MSDAPDDWNMYWQKCDRCGRSYHSSEGGCSCPAEEEPVDLETLEDLQSRLESTPGTPEVRLSWRGGMWRASRGGRSEESTTLQDALTALLT